ncbi:MAG: TraB/GumN family protein [Pyrinomonadaceae bacterium]
MKKLLLLLTIINAFAFGVSNARAQAVKTTNDSALLYEISGKNLKKPSYLFGTIHLICEKDMFAKEQLKSYLSQTGQLMLELNLSDPAVMQQAVKGYLLPDGKTTRDYLKPEEYAKLDEVFKNYLGVSYDNFQNFKPVLASVVLLTSPKIIGCQPPAAYDTFLMQTAAANKMPIVGLETVDAEFAALDAQPIEKQIEALNKLAADPEKSFADFKKQYQLYLAQNSDELYNQTVDEFKKDGSSQVKLLDERNASWIPVIEKNIAEEPLFIAVGAGHLGGEKGVINLLRARGYKVTPIRF